MARTATTRQIAYLGDAGIGGGLSSENAIVLAQNQMVIADNILVGTSLARRKRGGQERYHTGAFENTVNYPPSGGASPAIRGLTEYWRSDAFGTRVQDVFLHQDTKVWSIDDRNTVAVDRTGALVLSASGVPSYQVFNDILYFCSTETADGYNKWDGSAASAVAAVAPPDGPGKYLVAHLGRMVMAGNLDFPFRVYLSSAFDPEDWTTISPSDSTSLDIPADGDPEGITGIASFQNRLYVFLRRSIYEITGTTPATFVVQKITSGIGALSHSSIAQVPNDVLFTSDRGAHSLRQVASGRQTEVTFISRDIQRLWVELLNPALYSRVTAIYDEPTNNFIVSVPSSGQNKNDQLLCYNIEFGTWTVWPAINARSIAPLLLSNKRAILIGREDGSLVLVNRSQRDDFGAGYTARFKTGVLYPGGDPGVQKIFKSITVLASTTKSGNFSVGWDVDGKRSGSMSVDLLAGLDVLGSSFVLGSSKLGVGQYQPATVSIDEIGYGIQVEITATGTSDVEVYGFLLEVEDANPAYK